MPHLSNVRLSRPNFPSTRPLHQPRPSIISLPFGTFSITNYRTSAAQACTAVHLACQSPQITQVEYPRAHSEVTQHQKHNKSLIAAVVTSMLPPLRPFYTQNLITIQTGPFLASILEPTIKLANMQLMSTEDKRALEDLAGVMWSLGLTFKLSSKDSGKSMLCLEP